MINHNYKLNVIPMQWEQNFYTFKYLIGGVNNQGW